MNLNWKNMFLATGITVSVGMVALYALRLGSESEKPSDPYVLVIWAVFAGIYIFLGLRRWVWPVQTHTSDTDASSGG